LPENPPRWTDERVEQIIGNLLRAGVVIAALVVFVGGIWYLAQYAFDFPNYRHFDPGRVRELHSFSGIFRELARLESEAYIELGLLILIATPIARVIFSIAAFALERDRTYVIITILVLCVLLYSLIWGRF
jgi:uncharacterized membrane protein